MTRDKTHCAREKNSTPGHFRISGCAYKPIEKTSNFRHAKLNSKKAETGKGEGKKTTVSIDGLFIFLVQSFCTKGFSACTTALKMMLSLYVG